LNVVNNNIRPKIRNYMDVNALWARGGSFVSPLWMLMPYGQEVVFFFFLWMFMPYGQGVELYFSAWMLMPYGQGVELYFSTWMLMPFWL